MVCSMTLIGARQILSNSRTTETVSGGMVPSLAVLLAAFLCGGASVAWAQSAFPLSSLIDPDVALYIEVAHPDRDWQAWEQSELARRWKRTGLETLLETSEPVQNWRKVDATVAKATSQSLTDHIRGMCGEGLSLAVFVPKEGPPQGLWVSRARSAAVLDATLKAWDTLEPPLKTERRGSGRAEFFARRIRKGPREQILYFARRDEVLILSDHEQLVARCAERLSDQAANPPVATGKSFLVEAEAVVPEFATAAVWAYGNPRAWDRILNQEIDDSPGAQLARGVWKSLRGVGVSLRMDEGVTLTLAATLDPAQTHTGWKDAVDAQDPSDPLRTPEQLSILKAAPSDALAVAGGSLRPGWWLRRLQSLQSDKEREEVQRVHRVLRGAFGGLDPWTDVGAALFRDWGIFVVRKAPPGWWGFIPNDWHVASLHTLTATAEDRPELVTAIDDALGVGMQLLAAHANAETPEAHVVPVRTQTDGAIGRKITGIPIWDVGYEFAGKRLWLGWTTEDLHQTAIANTADRSPADTELWQLARQEFPHPALMAWINIVRARTAIVGSDRRAADNGESPTLLSISYLFDRAFAAVTLEPQRVEFKVGGRLESSP